MILADVFCRLSNKMDWACHLLLHLRSNQDQVPSQIRKQVLPWSLSNFKFRPTAWLSNVFPVSCAQYALQKTPSLSCLFQCIRFIWRVVTDSHITMCGINDYGPLVCSVFDDKLQSSRHFPSIYIYIFCYCVKDPFSGFCSQNRFNKLEFFLLCLEVKRYT